MIDIIVHDAVKGATRRGGGRRIDALPDTEALQAQCRFYAGCGSLVRAA